jgi:hypothetical protein
MAAAKCDTEKAVSPCSPFAWYVFFLFQCATFYFYSSFALQNVVVAEYPQNVEKLAVE